MRFADSVDVTAISISPWFRIAGDRAVLSGAGTFSQLDDGSSNYGTLDGSLFSGRRGFAYVELEGIAGGSAHSDGTRTGQTLALGRLHVASRSRGLWFGGGAGRTWSGAWRNVIQGDAGAWLVAAHGLYSLSASPTVVDDTIKYTDAFVSGHRELPDWDLDASLGGRVGAQLPTLPANRRIWGNVGATRWVTPTLGIVASVGSYPVDFTQGFPGGQFASIGVRLRSSPLRALVTRAPLPDPPPNRDPVRSFQVRRVSGTTHRVRVFAPTARSVDVTGDFTNWSPVALVADAAGWWTTTAEIHDGTHEITVRVNRGAWLVPPGLMPLKDEFGGTVGLLVVSP